MNEFTDPWQEEGLVAFQHPNGVPYLSDRRAAKRKQNAKSVHLHWLPACVFQLENRGMLGKSQYDWLWTKGEGSAMRTVKKDHPFPGTFLDSALGT